MIVRKREVSKRFWSNVLACIVLVNEFTTPVGNHRGAVGDERDYSAFYGFKSNLSGDAAVDGGTWSAPSLTGLTGLGYTHLSPSGFIPDHPKGLTQPLIVVTSATETAAASGARNSTASAVLSSNSTEHHFNLLTPITPSSEASDAPDNHPGGDSTPAKGPGFDSLRYLTKPKPPDGFVTPRPLLLLLPISSRPVWDVEVACMAAVALQLAAAFVPRVLALVQQLPHAVAAQQRVLAVQSTVHSDWGQLQVAANAALGGTAHGTMLIGVTVATPSQQLEYGAMYSLYMITNTGSGITQHTNPGSNQTNTQATATATGTSTDSMPAGQSSASTGATHTSGNPGSSPGGGGGEPPPNNTPGGPTHQTPDPSLVPSLTDILGMDDLGMLVALNVQHEDLTALQQRTQAWHKARITRITASDVPVITGACPQHWGRSAQQVVDNKVKWDAALCKGETPDYSAGLSPNTLRRMQIGVEQEAPAVAQYLDYMTRHYNEAVPGTDWTVLDQTVGMCVHPRYPWLAASPDRKIIAGDMTTQSVHAVLLEVKVCVDSNLPTQLPQHVLHQVVTQLECCQYTAAHVWYTKAGHDPVWFAVHYDGESDNVWVQSSADQQVQELQGVWNGMLDQLLWTYYKQLAPSLILQRAKQGFIPLNLLPAPTRDQGTAHDRMGLPQQHLDTARQLLSGVVASASSVPVEDWKYVVHTGQASWGVATILEVKPSKTAGGKPKLMLRFPKRATQKTGRKGFKADAMLHVVSDKPTNPSVGRVGQVVQMLGGTHAGKYGITIKVGATTAKWTVELQDQTRTEVMVENIHVLDPPNSGQENTGWDDGHAILSLPSRPLYNSQRVDLGHLSNWLDEYRNSPTEPMEFCVVDNRRHALQPVPAARPVLGDATNQQANTAGAPASSEAASSSAAAAAPTVAGVAAPSALHPATEVADASPGEEAIDAAALAAVNVDSEWTLSLGCRRGHATVGRKVSSMKACDCKFSLVIKHPAGAQHVLVTERCWHTNHDVSDDAQANYLKPTEAGVQQCWALIEAGVKPSKICDVLNKQIDLQSKGTSVKDFINSFNNPRARWTRGTVVAQQKAWRRSTIADYMPDTAQVEMMVNHQCKSDTLWYQPYKAPDDDAGSEEQPFALVLANKFQLSMLNQFGRKLVHLDGTGGTNKNGFWLSTLLVVDEYNNGVPVGMMITSSEGAEVQTQFLLKMREAVRTQAPEGGDFDFKYIMIDKSATEAAAIREVCGGDAFVYCYFHFLQEWERFCRSAKARITESTVRADVLGDLSALAHTSSETVFKTSCKTFITKWSSYKKVVTNFKVNWQPCAKHWAHFGRPDILALCRDTNNHLERFQGILKYDFLGRKTKSSVPVLMNIIVSEVGPRYARNRAEKLGRNIQSRAAIAEAKKTAAAQQLIDGKQVRMQDAAIGLAQAGSSSGGFYQVCLAELSCSCPDHTTHKCACKHLQAVELSPHCPSYTHGMRLEAATRINNYKALAPIGSSALTAAKLHQCESLATLGKLGGEACYTISMHEPYCSCLGFTLHGSCIHLIAAANIPDMDDIVTTTAWAHLDSATSLAVIPTMVTTPPSIEPLTDEVWDALCKAQEVVPASVHLHNLAASTPAAQFAPACQDAQRNLKALPAAQQESFVKDIEVLASRIKAVRLDANLPVTTRKFAVAAAKHWRRQHYQIYVRALFVQRTKNALSVVGKQMKALKQQRAAQLLAGVAKAAADDTAGTQGKLPVVQGSGRPRTKLVGIAAGGGWVRGGHKSYGIPYRTAMRAAAAAATRSETTAASAAEEAQAAGSAYPVKGSFSRSKAARRKPATMKPMSGADGFGPMSP